MITREVIKRYCTNGQSGASRKRLARRGLDVQQEADVTARKVECQTVDTSAMPHQVDCQVGEGQHKIVAGEGGPFASELLRGRVMLF